MNQDCYYCTADDAVIARVGNARLMVPQQAHLTGEDGGHLVAVPPRHVASRREMTPYEVLAVDGASIVGSLALEHVFDTSWTNYQENGNWTVDVPDGSHAHLHIYGRRRGSPAQPFGEALAFPERAQIASWKVSGLTPSEISRLRSAAEAQIKNETVLRFVSVLQDIDQK